MRAKFLKSIFKISCVVTLVALVVLCLFACGDKVQKEPSETISTETTYSEVKYFQYAFGVSIEKSSILDDVPISFYDKNGETFLRDIVEVSKDKANYEGLCTFNKEDDAPVRYLLTSLEHKGLTLVLDFDDKSVVSKVSGYIDSDAENRIVLEFDYNTDGNISKIKTSKGVYREYLYDDNGNAVEVVICNAEGSVTQCIKNEYDDNGYCINVETYNAHNNYTGGYEFKYDENAIEGIVYNNYKNITSKYVREFDDNGNIVKNTDYNSRGEVVRINGYKYNGNRQKIEQTFYSTDGAILNVERYEYDSKINLVKTSTYNKDGLLVFDIVNEYGDDGNLLTVSNITYSSDGSKDCVEVKDSKDRLLSHSKFYADGEMWYQATYEYPNDNILYIIPK